MSEAEREVVARLLARWVVMRATDGTLHWLSPAEKGVRLNPYERRLTNAEAETVESVGSLVEQYQ